jgi:hypothetical protein
VVFIIDGSASLGIANYQLLKEFAADIVGNLTVDANHARVGALVFSSSVRVLFTYASLGYSQAAIQNALLNAIYLNGATATASALAVAKQAFYNQTYLGQPTGWRQGAVPQIAIVVCLKITA